MLLFKCNIFLKFLFLVLVNLVCANSKISDKRTCVDEKCEVPISEGVTNLRYFSPGENILSFLPKEKVTIFSKSAGSNPSLWGVEINGKRGYVPKAYIKELRIFKEPTKLVKTEFASDSFTIEVPFKGPKETETLLNPEPVKEPYELIDGTKVPIDVGDVSEENNSDKSNVEADKKKRPDANNQKDSKIIEESDTDEFPSRFISEVYNFLTNSDDKNNEPVDVTANNERKEEEEDDMDDDDDDDAGIEDEDEDGDAEMDDDDEEMESKEKNLKNSLSNENSAAKPELDIIYSQNLNTIKRSLLEFNEEPLKIKNNDTENLEEVVTQKDTSKEMTNPTSEKNVDNFKKISNNIQNSKNQELIEEKTGNASSESTEDKDQHDGKVKEQAEVNANKNSEAKSISETSDENKLNGTEPNPSQFNVDSLETKNNETYLNKIITQKDNPEDKTSSTLIKNAGKSEGFSGNLNTLNSENQGLSEGKKNNESKGKSLNALPENVDKEQHEDKIKQQIERVPDKNSAKINDLQQSTNDSEKLFEIEANKNSETKSASGTSGEKYSSDTESNPFYLNAKSLKTKYDEINLDEITTQNNKQKNNAEEVTNPTIQKNTSKSEDFSSNLINSNNFTEINVNILTSESQEQHEGKMKRNSESILDEYPVEINILQQNTNDSEKISEVDLKNNPVEIKHSIGNELNETFDSGEIQKKDSGVKLFELKETQQDETMENIQNVQEISKNILEDLTQNTKEDSTITTNENRIQNTPSDLGQNIHEDLTQNIQENLIPDEILTTGNNKKEHLNFANNDPLISQSSELHSDSFYKNFKSESNNIPESFPVNSGKEKQDEDQNVNQKVTNEIYQSHLFIHKNKDNQLSEREATSTSGTEQGNEYCLESENAELCALDKRDSASGNDFFQETIMEFLLNLPNDVVSTVLITTFTTILFLLGYIYIDKLNRIRPLIAKINKLEKALLLAEEENKLVEDKLLQQHNDMNEKANDNISSDVLDSLQQQLEDAINSKTSLEEQIVNLEKELENSTEVGLELNRMLSDFLSSQDSDVLVANIEQLQRQLVEQQGTINSYSETLNVKETEIHELRLELEISNSKVTDLQRENERATANLLKTEEEKFELQNKLESEVNALKKHIEQLTISSTVQINKLSDELKAIQKKAEESQRNAELKTKEYSLLKENTLKLKTLKDEDVRLLLDVAAFKAELELLSKEKQLLSEHCKQSDEVKNSLEKQYQNVVNEMQTLQRRYDEADKEKLEAQTKLEVLENYFKEREANLQKELAKYEAMFMEKQGETYSITEKIKFMQEELQNYKAQNESLKQEIMEQEVQMKSQISLLEKRVHENWVNARQAERRLEEAKQEASQLRNRLTIRERSLQEEKYQSRLKSSSEQNGELPVSPSPASPPLIFGARDLTTSPPLQGLPPPFLPPPPFMPPPIPGGVPPPFMPPPSSMPPLQAMFPSDRRPAPLGRMSSPPIDSRYSPDSRAYSPYSRNSPSPTSDDDYRHSPPPLHRGYSPINNRESKREYRRSPGASKVSRNHKGSMHSSGSANSNESLEKIARKPSKV